MTNSAETSPNHSDPRLSTRFYPRREDLNALLRAIEQIISRMTTYGRRWRLTQPQRTDTPSQQLIIRVEVPVFLFTDDLEVRVQPSEEENFWIVNIWSASRVGKSDLGENRRHVLQLLTALDRQFQP